MDNRDLLLGELKAFRDQVTVELKEIRDEIKSLSAWKWKIVGASSFISFVLMFLVEFFRH